MKKCSVVSKYQNSGKIAANVLGVILLALVSMTSIFSKEKIEFKSRDVLMSLYSILNQQTVDVDALKSLALNSRLSFKHNHAILKPGMLSIGRGFGFFSKTNSFYDGRNEKDGVPNYRSPLFATGYNGGVSCYSVSSEIVIVDCSVLNSQSSSERELFFVISPFGFVILDGAQSHLSFFTSDYWNSGHRNKLFPWLKIT